MDEWEKLTYSKKEGGLGFRDFKAFNMAMVAKQGWYMLSKPNALVSRIFSSRYFPRISFLDAKLGYNPSFVWRSMWKAREVLMLGCRWSIGDGRNISVMNEPWIRGSREGCEGGPQKQAVEEIIQVPLLEEVCEDKVIWKEEQSGCYSVRSGYRIWRNATKRGREISNLHNWNSLWNIKAPARAKHFLWRICNDCLPSRVRLRQHHVPCPVECPFCNNNVEDAWHVFFGCAETNKGWQAAGLSNIIDHRILSFDDVKLLIFDICTKEDRHTAGRVAVMLEGLWKNQNDLIWHNEREEATKIGWLAYHICQEWFAVQKKSEDDHIPHHSHLWEPPPHGWLKCNVDAGFNKNCGTYNRGWCIRDSSGNFHTAGTSWDVGEVSVIEGEALALKEAIHIATYMGLNRIIFESDSLRVVQALSNKITGDSELFTTLRIIQSSLCNFPNFEVKFIKRQANMVAHALAKTANSWARRNVTHNIPLCIDTLIHNERS